jgi:hypothetical protein
VSALPAALYPALPGRVIEAGGARCTYAEAGAAVAVLERSAGLMVRQPLAAAGSVLAACDYHAAAAPWKDPSALPRGGRGAAGRHVTKTAFIAALRHAMEAAASAEPARHFGPEISAARSAFGADPAFGAAMASAAVAIARRRHRESLRSALRRSVAAATAACTATGGACALEVACGTGGCRFATGALALVTSAAVSAPEGGGAVRPACHADAGAGFSLGAALDALAAAVPWRPALPVADGDCGHGRDFTGRRRAA